VLLFVTESEYLFREDNIISITAEHSPPSRFSNAAFEYRFPHFCVRSRHSIDYVTITGTCEFINTWEGMIGPTYRIANFAWTFHLNSRLQCRYSVACLATVCYKKRFWNSKLALSTLPLTSYCIWQFYNARREVEELWASSTDKCGRIEHAAGVYCSSHCFLYDRVRLKVLYMIIYFCIRGRTNEARKPSNTVMLSPTK
jgi:hypothetical protein